MPQSGSVERHGGAQLGLGCSRLGSALTRSQETPEALLLAAYKAGIRYFDTADIYGQGDSERFIGRTVAHLPQARICTKVGQRFPLKMRLLLPIKAPLKRLASLSPAVAARVKAARAGTLPTSFEPAYLAGALEKSLKRLGVDAVDTVMLHGATAQEIASGTPIGVLDGLRERGLFRRLGVSCEDLDGAEAALADPRVAVAQIPLHFGDLRARDIAARLADRGIEVIAREILTGSAVHNAEPPAARQHALRMALDAALHAPGVSVALLGTTSSAHLLEAVEAL